MKPILVTSYVNPDLDGVASAIAYAEYLRTKGTDAVAGMTGELQGEATWVLNRFGGMQPIMIPNADGFDAVVLVDASSPDDLEGTVSVEKVTEIIDHRAVHEAEKFPNAAAHIELVGAAATLIAEKFMHDNTAITKSSAALLYGAIISNTLNFQGSMTTGRDRDAGAWLNAIAQLPDDYWREQFTAKSDLSGDKLAKRIEDDFATFFMGGKKVGIAELELIGAKPLLDARGYEIDQILQRLKKEMHLDVVFQNTIELNPAASWLATKDPETQDLLIDAFHIRFMGDIAQLPHPLMRKQIVPLLKKVMEQSTAHSMSR